MSNEISQEMTYREREHLKKFAYECQRNGDVKSATEMLILVAHWMRQCEPVAFHEYASEWIESMRDRDEITVFATDRMAKEYTLDGKSRLRDGYSQVGITAHKYPIKTC